MKEEAEGKEIPVMFVLIFNYGRRVYPLPPLTQAQEKRHKVWGTFEAND